MSTSSLAITKMDAHSGGAEVRGLPGLGHTAQEQNKWRVKEEHM